MTDYEFSAFSFGKRWIDDGVGYGTVMSYDTSPISTYPNTIPYFSNPDVLYLSTSTGNYGTEDNAKVLNFSAPYVSNFRSSVVQGIVPSRFSLNLSESKSASFTVRLATQPDNQIDVNVSIAGAENVLLSSAYVISFNSSYQSDNWKFRNL